MSPTVAAITFGIVFVAELPDKTALASLVLGTRYRVGHVFAGIAAAFAVHVALAVAAGSLLALLPHRWVEGIVGALFLAGAAMLLLHRDDAEEGHPAREPADDSFWRVAGSGFLLVLVAEFGDLTQIATANLAARYADPLAVAVGAWLALCAVAAAALLGGKALLSYVSLAAVTRVAAVAMVVMAAFSIAGAVTG